MTNMLGIQTLIAILILGGFIISKGKITATKLLNSITVQGDFFFFLEYEGELSIIASRGVHGDYDYIKVMNAITPAFHFKLDYQMTSNHWLHWGYWASPFTYALNAVALNGFFDKRWATVTFHFLDIIILTIYI